MRIIAHRGLTDGPDNLTENTVPQIESALHQGFDCEIDLWRLNDRLYLGHDKPREEVSESWVTKKILLDTCQKRYCYAMAKQYRVKLLLA